MDIPIENILERMATMECKIEQIIKCISQPETVNFPAFLTMDGLADYLLHQTGKRPAKATIYGWINKKTVPYVKRDHSVLFEREKIDGWLVSGRKSTNDEIKVQADLRMVAANRKRRKSIIRSRN